MNTDQAQQDGADAFRAGKTVKDCPISAFDGELFDAWCLGWLDARDHERRSVGVSALPSKIYRRKRPSHRN